MSSTSSSALAQIPTSDLTHFKCTKCSKLLSVTPIILATNGLVCGRCKSVHPKGSFRSKGFEILAQYFLFPCSYYNKGCKAVLQFNNVLNHENTCSIGAPPLARGNKCPHCKAKVNEFNVEEHFGIHHETFIIKALPFKSSISQKHAVDSTQLILRHKNVGPFLLQIESNPQDSCFVALFSLTDTPTKHLYNLTVVSCDKSQNSCTYGSRSIERYNGKCGIRTSTNSYLVPNWLATMKYMVGNSNFYFVVDLVDSSDNGTLASTSNTNPVTATLIDVTPSPPAPITLKTETKNSLMEELECWLCKEYLTPPIYNCSIGHSVCSGCKAKLQICPICQAPYTGSRNFALEKLIERLDQYPCKNNTMGCPLLTTLKLKPEHEQICPFRSVSCPFQMKMWDVPPCLWTGSVKCVEDHAKISHDFSGRCALNPVQFIDYPCTTTNMQIFTFDDAHFILKVKSYMGILYFRVVEIGGDLSRPKPKYIYVIEFIDQTFYERILTANMFCIPLWEGDNAFISDECMPFYDNQLRPFVKEQKLSFKITMKKSKL